MNVHAEKNPDLEHLAYAVRRAFAETAEGLHTPAELRSTLDWRSHEPIALNQVISLQASAFSQSINQLGGMAFPASASFGTSPGVVFGSVLCHQG